MHDTNLLATSQNTSVPRLVRLLREPHGPNTSGPLLVLLHGLGSHEGDLMNLATDLSPSLRVVTLRAPFPYSAGGFAWFALHWDEKGIRVDPSEILRSLDVLTEELEHLKAEFSPTKIILGGFSQGAIMTVGASLWRPDLIQSAMSLSGRYIPELVESAAAGASQVKFLVQHGLYDQVLPVTGSEALANALTDLGSEVEYREYPMAHEVSWPSLRDASSWLDRQLL